VRAAAVPVFPKILYVDDDRDTCEMMEILLGLDHSEYQVTSVCDARKAFDLIESGAFDLYVFDYAMPVFSGVELCRQVRLSDADTPVIFYSAMARTSDKNDGLLAGATEYLVKPNDLDRLIDTIPELLSRKLRPTPTKTAENATNSQNI